jgi:hypothetical protein
MMTRRILDPHKLALENAAVLMAGPSDDEFVALDPLVVPIMPHNKESVREALVVEQKQKQKHQLCSRLLLQMEVQQKKALDDYHSRCLR